MARQPPQKAVKFLNPLGLQQSDYLSIWDCANVLFDDCGLVRSVCVIGLESLERELLHVVAQDRLKPAGAPEAVREATAATEQFRYGVFFDWVLRAHL